jgi:tyrosyl-tRNA synthetase
MRLAFEITKIYHGKSSAEKAEKSFIQTFQKHEIPTDLPSFEAASKDLISILIESELVPSKSEARRILKQKAVKINGKIVTNENEVIASGSVLQKGKTHFLKIL